MDNLQSYIAFNLYFTFRSFFSTFDTKSKWNNIGFRLKNIGVQIGYMERDSLQDKNAR
jgi:hypothetical protein